MLDEIDGIGHIFLVDHIAQQFLYQVFAHGVYREVADYRQDIRITSFYFIASQVVANENVKNLTVLAKKFFHSLSGSQ